MAGFRSSLLNCERLLQLAVAKPSKHGLNDTVAPDGWELKSAAGRRPYSVIQLLTKCHPSAVEPHLKVFLGHIEDFGCFSGTHLLDVAEHDHRTVGLRKGQQRILQEAARFTYGRLFVRWTDWQLGRAVRWSGMPSEWAYLAAESLES